MYWYLNNIGGKTKKANFYLYIPKNEKDPLSQDVYLKKGMPIIAHKNNNNST